MPVSGVICPIAQEFINMSKHEKSNRESKKQPLLNPKEKKAAKMAKKHAGDHVPLIVRNP
jgi:hypothetical protein